MTPLQLLQRIASLQSTGDRHYQSGLFPSQRFHKWVPYKREDNNIFYSSLIAFTLQQLAPQLGPLNELAHSIIGKVAQNYGYYKNQKGKPWYNFWQTNPPQYFPNGLLLRHFSYFELAEDADDSAIIHLCGNFPAGESQQFLAQLERQYPSQQPSSPLTPARYLDLKGYPTFFGKKILREMDACVLSNILYLILAKDLPWSPTADQSLIFLERTLQTGDFLQQPFAVAPHYGNAAVIYYHLSRLCSAFPHSKVSTLKPLLLSYSQRLKALEWDFMEQILLASSWLRLGEEPLQIVLPDNYHQAFSRFGFFQAGMLTVFQKSSLRYWAAHPFFHLKFRCTAYYYTLILEHQLLRDHSKSSRV